MKKYTIAVIMGLIPLGSSACSCPKETLTAQEYIDAAKTIYAGVAIKSEIVRGEGIKTTFKVLHTFKGLTSSTETVISNAAGECNISYEIGVSHIILTDDIEFVSSCSGYSEYYPTYWDEREPGAAR